MNLSSFIILFICTYTLTCLHLKHQITSSYLNYLRNQHSTVSNKINDLKSDVTDTQFRIENTNDIDQKINILEQAILRQKGIVRQASKHTDISLQQSDWTCPQFQKTSRGQLGEIANQLKSKTDDLQDSINNYDQYNIKGQKELKNDAKESSAYAQKIVKNLMLQGKTVKPSDMKTKTQTNILADNIAAKDQNQLQDKLSSDEKNYQYVENCPLDNPYFNGEQCVKCPAQNPIFNIASRECISCPDYDKSKQICPSIPNFDNFNFPEAKKRFILPKGKTISDIKNEGGTVYCPSYRPFFKDGNCINCESPTTLFDYESKECTKCEDQKVYISEKSLCLSGDEFVTNLAVGQDKMILPKGKTIKDLLLEQDQKKNNANVEICPTKTPFFNGSTCINCEDDKYFSVEGKNCLSCERGKAYNVDTHSCVPSITYSNINNPYWTSTNVPKTKEDINDLRANKVNVQCPYKAPFYNGNKCISCNQGYIFSFEGRKCTKCEEGTKFNINLHSCVNPLALYQTNPETAPNLIYGGVSKNEWASDYAKNLQQNPETADCPPSKPYYDGITCIKCPSSHPYFNLLQKRCQICNANSNYDSDVHECLSNEGNIVVQLPNIEKMAAGIFT